MFNIKIAIIVGLVSAIFFSFGAIYVYRDFNTPYDKLKSDSAFLRATQISLYLDKSEEIPQLDIFLYDKRYFVRLSTDYKRYWQQIQNESNKNKLVQVKYVEHLLANGILHNPNEVRIGESLVIQFGANDRDSRLLAILQKKYNLNIKSLKNSLGWFEIKKLIGDGAACTNFL